jgi:hypothetical protein
MHPWGKYVKHPKYGGLRTKIEIKTPSQLLIFDKNSKIYLEFCKTYQKFVYI